MLCSDEIKIVESLLARSFEFDCFNMQLSQQRDEDPVKYIGAGFVKQSPNGTIECKLYAKYVENDALFRCDKTQPGQLYARGEMFSLRASGQAGIHWEGSDLIVGTDRISDGGGLEVVAKAKIDRLVSRFPASEVSDSVICVFRVENWTDWEWLDCDGLIFNNSLGQEYHVSSERCGDAIAVQVSSTDRLPENITSRLGEALSFVLARAPQPVMWIRERDGLRTLKITGPVDQDRRVRLFPPIDLKNPWYRGDVRRLFCLYIQYITSDPAAHWHHCSAQLFHAQEASCNALDAWGTGLCVALEGVAGLLPHERSGDHDHQIAEVRKVVRKWLECRNFDSSIADRANGLLSQLVQVRVKDRIQPLIESGVVEKRLLDAWSKLRNSRAHAARANEETFIPAVLQEILDQINAVTTLLYQLVFCLVEYEGPHVNYANHGFPDCRHNNRKDLVDEKVKQD